MEMNLWIKDHYEPIKKRCPRDQQVSESAMRASPSLGLGPAISFTFPTFGPRVWMAWESLIRQIIPDGLYAAYLIIVRRRTIDRLKENRSLLS